MFLKLQPIIAVIYTAHICSSHNRNTVHYLQFYVTNAMLSYYSVHVVAHLNLYLHMSRLARRFSAKHLLFADSGQYFRELTIQVYLCVQKVRSVLL